MHARPTATILLPSNPRPTPVCPARGAAFEVCEPDALVDVDVDVDEDVPLLLPETEELPDVVDPDTEELPDSDTAEVDCNVPEDESDVVGDEADGMDTDGRDAVGIVVKERERDTDGRVTEVGMLKLVACDGERQPLLFRRPASIKEITKIRRQNNA
ncbi:hypothetical protein L227DRAFT_657827 [Lentinus tigrinus ALCF2SS1-6]|uniref:Uncharacterized protein n=1 Tax=Lentinus tigrinus ALCF2SS1-6 TaxID=1328759 RepID=A0A5C2RSW3_9APHY|nr:hypothetical protein L227DRAFT_657827 [Lentinus tigrinus ALCF2SS1-6]